MKWKYKQDLMEIFRSWGSGEIGRVNNLMTHIEPIFNKAISGQKAEIKFMVAGMKKDNPLPPITGGSNFQHNSGYNQALKNILKLLE